MSLPYNKDLIPRARQLRAEMTKHERHLWYDFLASYSVRFQRQKTIDNYIADFYCHKAALVVELDGAQHYEEETLAYDEARTEILESLGLSVIRFINREVDENFAGVCEAIDEKVRARTFCRFAT